MKIALVGNPNSGKTTLFNRLTGLNQKTGNYPGVTVDKKSGRLRSGLSSEKDPIEIIDLPGLYSVYPKTEDERIAVKLLTDEKEQPDVYVMLADSSNLERNLLLFTQLRDLQLPVVLALNMTDLATKKGLKVDVEKLSEVLGEAPVVAISARNGNGIADLLDRINQPVAKAGSPFLDKEFDKEPTDDTGRQQAWTHDRYKKIRQALTFVIEKSADDGFEHRQRRADRILTHPFWGYVIFIGVLLLIFQAIYAWAEWPMNLIDEWFFAIGNGVKSVLPEGVLTDLLAEGIVPGIGGVVIFIPQIALLFLFLFILEETGYMSRVVFILDRLMRPFGLNGRSAVPLVSGVACAIPAVMATRTIENWKERLSTILVTPLMSCSARLPVYTLLIALVVPDTHFGPFNLQGLVLMGMYLLGLVAALLVAWVLKFFLKSTERSFLIMELPNYRMPRWNNVLISIWEKVSVFVFEAGKVILAISVILWVLASYGPGDRMALAAQQVERTVDMTEAEYEAELNGARLANSYIGILGKGIEPAIAPLGYNWQIGIALITSFAAREVFVGSMATIYSVGEDFEESDTLLSRMKAQKHANGELVYTFASGLSLMIFYAFAMQCMSTLAVVLRETKSWKWPLLQLGYMTGLAYVSALIAYQLLK